MVYSRPLFHLEVLRLHPMNLIDRRFSSSVGNNFIRFPSQSILPGVEVCVTVCGCEEGEGGGVEVWVRGRSSNTSKWLKVCIFLKSPFTVFGCSLH